MPGSGSWSARMIDEMAVNLSQSGFLLRVVLIRIGDDIDQCGTRLSSSELSADKTASRAS